MNKKGHHTVWFIYKFPFHPRKILRRGEFFKPAGSDTMRALQLSKLVKPFLNPNISVRAIPFKSNDRWGVNKLLHNLRRKGVVILSKNLAYKLNAEEMHSLRKNSVALGVDHVDADLSRFQFWDVDFHVSASLSGHRAIRRICENTGKYVGMLTHHADPRLNSLYFSTYRSLRSVYLGDPSTLNIPNSLASQVKILKATTNSEMRIALPILPNYNFHYAVRTTKITNDHLRAHKPFTKGANAAICKSNIIVHRQADDVKEAIGEDYPYLISDYSTKSIEECFLYAKESFGCADWALGLSRMEYLRQKTHPKEIARQLEEIVEEVT